MCFCFDGDYAVVALRPESCRERGRTEGTSPVQPSPSAGKPDRLDAASRSELIDTMRLPQA